MRPHSNNPLSADALRAKRIQRQLSEELAMTHHHDVIVTVWLRVCMVALGAAVLLLGAAAAGAARH